MEQLRRLSPLQNLLYMAGGVLLVIGAALPIFVADFGTAFFVFAAGVSPFVWMQLLQGYDGKRLAVRRLRRQQLLGAFLLVVTAGLMFTRWQHIRPLSGDEWKVTLAIAAFLELYAAFRLPQELQKGEG